MTVKLACTVEGISGAGHVAALWRRHYSSLLNCVKSGLYEDDSDMSNESVAIMTHKVCEAICKVPDGTEQVSAEHPNCASLR